MLSVAVTDGILVQLSTPTLLAMPSPIKFRDAHYALKSEFHVTLGSLYKTGALSEIAASLGIRTGETEEEREPVARLKEAMAKAVSEFSFKVTFPPVRMLDGDAAEETTIARLEPTMFHARKTYGQDTRESIIVKCQVLLNGSLPPMALFDRISLLVGAPPPRSPPAPHITLYTNQASPLGIGLYSEEEFAKHTTVIEGKELTGLNSAMRVPPGPWPDISSDAQRESPEQAAEREVVYSAVLKFKDSSLEEEALLNVSPWGRRCAHIIAEALGLGHRSVGDGEDRQLVLSKTPNPLEPRVGRKSHIPVGAAEILEKRLFLGSGMDASDLLTLRCLGVTHIVNMASDWSDAFPGFFEYHKVPITDEENTNITEHFDGVVDFVDRTLDSGGRVLVHCILGKSRSATAVIAYLMKSQKMSLHDAFHHVKERRPIVHPNDGFMRQLMAYETQLTGVAATTLEWEWGRAAWGGAAPKKIVKEKIEITPEIEAFAKAMLTPELLRDASSTCPAMSREHTKFFMERLNTLIDVDGDTRARAAGVHWAHARGAVVAGARAWFLENSEAGPPKVKKGKKGAAAEETEGAEAGAGAGAGAGASLEST